MLSSVGIFEDLDFNRPLELEYDRSVCLTITKNAKIDGFLVWLTLQTIEGEVIDILEQEYCWLPVYFPVFYPGVEVEEGDVIKAVCSGTVCENNFNIDYRIKGSLLRKSGEVIEFDWQSFHYKIFFKATPFYQFLFEGDTVKIKSSEESSPTDWHTEHISQWQTLYDENHSQLFAPEEPTFNISGWNSSYTSLPIPETEMREWVEQTVNRIQALQPQRLLEIGCGTGLLRNYIM